MRHAGDHHHHDGSGWSGDAYADGMEQIVKQVDPSFVFLTHTYQVRDFAPKLAAMLGKGMIGDCVGCRAEKERT